MFTPNVTPEPRYSKSPRSDDGTTTAARRHDDGCTTAARRRHDDGTTTAQHDGTTTAARRRRHDGGTTTAQHDGAGPQDDATTLVLRATRGGGGRRRSDTHAEDHAGGRRRNDRQDQPATTQRRQTETHTSRENMHRQALHTGSPFSKGRLRLMQSKKPKSTHKLRGPLHLPQVACRHGKQFFKIENSARRPAALTRRGSRRLCTSLVFLHFFTAQTYRAAGGRRQQERLGRCGLALRGVRFEKGTSRNS